MVNKVYEVIDTIENSDLKKMIKDAKEKIYNDSNAKELIKGFNDAKDLYERYGYKEDFIKAKTNLMKEPIIKEFLKLQNEVNMLSLYINKR